MSMYDKNMSEEKKASLEFAEEQRETEWTHPSFALQLFHGSIDWGLIHPFPKQSQEERKKGDEYIDDFMKFLKEELDPNEVDKTGTIPDNVMKGLAERKAFALKIPKEYGGMEFSQVNYNRIMHVVASYCGSTAVLLSAHQSIGVPQPLKLFGTEAQKKKYLPMFADGVVSAFALTEPEAGSDPRSMTTTAVPTEDGNHYLINGDKLWCTNGLIAGVIVIMAVTPPKIVKGKERKQITAFIVEMDSPGIEKVHRCEFMGLHGIQNGLIRFKDVKVPKENIILGEGEGLKLALNTLNTGRLTLPAASVGIGKWCLYVSRKWSQERSQWGSEIGKHESVAKKIAYIASHTYAMDAMTWLTSEMADDKKKDIRLEAAIAKYFCTEESWKIVDMTLQIRGGQGYETADSLKKRGAHPWAVERALRDVRINLIIEGTSEIMHLFIAREALDPHLKAAQKLFGKASIFEKIKTIIGMQFKYLGLWMPKMAGVGDMHPKLKGHMQFVQSASQKLGRAIFHNMAKHQKKLESKQAVLARVVDIGVELFAIATTCSYTQHLIASNEGKENAIELADLYCDMARTRINNNFKEGVSNHDSKKMSTAKQVMADEFEWLENEIIKED